MRLCQHAAWDKIPPSGSGLGHLYDVTRANASPVWEPETTVHTAHPASDRPELL
jgi:hypothetical protein